ncbi:mucin-2-like isoform X2 [Stegostoma tigrinum]|uniref:mucin-2-like isoform X2 n=1 Tax=Stegostoma tigrinum TaxID=3053191 RepID=UPI0028701B8D|nr:mucin-2-like isoform X2 [Stegostoma tigrinum]
MAYCRGVLLFTLLCIYDPVPAHRHSAITESCCKNVLEMPFPRKNYSRLEYYTILPSIKRCPQRLQFSTKGGISFCTSMRNGQQMKEFLDSQSKAPSETRPSKEFQIGRKETTGSREAASKGTFRPAISTPPQVSPVSSVPTAALHPQGSSPNPSVPLSPLPTSTQGYEANPEPTSSVTALPESHGHEDSPSLPPTSSSGQLQAVTTGGWDKATYRADFHPWNGTGTAPLRAITTVTAPSNDHGTEETRTGEVTNRPTPSETRPSKEFQIGRKETTGSREAASKGTFRPAISTPPQVSPVSSVPTAAPHPQGSSPNPSVPLSPLPTSTQGYEANPEPTSSVTALPESHGREDSPSPPPASSSGQLQAVTTGGWDKATYRADFHPWNGTGTAPLRAITTVTAPSNDHGMEETRTGEVTNRPTSQGRTMAEMARNRHPLVSKERNRASWEGPGGQRLHIGLMVVFVGAVVLILWMALISRACGQASTLADNFPWHHGEDRATLLRYSRHSEALCGTV